MRSMRKSPCSSLLLIFCFALSAVAQNYKVLYSFTGVNGDGAQPSGSLAVDAAGNLYGTTEYGGAGEFTYGAGTVFELSPNSDGTWTESVLYSFCASGTCTDGAAPQGGVILDSKGNLYGTTFAGGSPPSCNGSGGCGTVFELSPPSLPNGSWTETTLYNFCSLPSCEDGKNPVGTLTTDADGNLYGATNNNDGSAWGGTVFKLSNNTGVWTQSTLYLFCQNNFNNNCPDGQGPMAGVVFDSRGNLYGTTVYGGSPSNLGSVYRLTPKASGGWRETVLINFNPPETGLHPTTGVTPDPSGYLYGSTPYGSDNYGTIFRLRSDGQLREFEFNGNNGSHPLSNLLLEGNVLYGTMAGEDFSSGSVFKIEPHAEVNIIYNFCQQPMCTDGAYPEGNL